MTTGYDQLETQGMIGRIYVGDLYTNIYEAKKEMRHINYIERSFTNLKQLICHSLSADSRIGSYWGCPNCHRTKMIE